MTTATAAIPQHIVGTWTLASSMIHGGDEVLGTTKLFRRKGWIYDGRKITIPMVSGNALGGLWRRACALAFLDAYAAAGGPSVSLSAFYYLTSGGALKKGATTGGLPLSVERDLRALVPMAGLFGGAGLGKIQEGKVYIDEAIPVCRETVDRLARIWPDVRDAETAGMSIRELVEVHGYSRQDDAKNMEMHRYLDSGAKQEALALIEKTQESDVAAAAGSPQQMRYEQEELVAGTVLFHRWGFSVEPTETELAALAAGLMRWGARPRVGGRNARGHGNLLLDYRGANAEVRLIGDGDASAVMERRTADETLRDHIEAHRDAITSVLAAL